MAATITAGGSGSGNDDGSDEESSSEEDESDDDSSDDDGGNNTNNNSNNTNNNSNGSAAAPDGLLSDYERLRLQRIKRNQERLSSSVCSTSCLSRRYRNRNNSKKKKKARAEARVAAVAKRSQPKRTAKDNPAGTTSASSFFDVRTMRISSDPTYYDRKSQRGSSERGEIFAQVSMRNVQGM